MIREEDIILRIGEQPLQDLSENEKILILTKFNDIDQAILRIFFILKNKFYPYYKVGRVYIDQSRKYELYKEIYDELSKHQTGFAGRSRTERDKAYDVIRNKFRLPNGEMQ